MLFEAKETVIDRVEAQLCPYLAHFDAGQRHVSLFVSNLDHKGLDATGFTLN